MGRLRELAGIAGVVILTMFLAICFQAYQTYRASFALQSASLQQSKPIRLASADGEFGFPNGDVTPVQPDGPQSVATDSQADPSTMQGDAVAERVKDSVPAELMPYFDTYLYVSKSANGTWAQHMFVFHRTDDGRLVYEDSFPVSTGRERREKYFTSTPTGIFQLDPKRFDAHHRSRLWNNVRMPWAMFLNYTIHGRLSGIALHSAIGHMAMLGRRASGGCVRMPPEKAEMYFKRFKAEEYGEVPVFAFDGNTTNTEGRLVRDETGEPEMTMGYKVLLIIQNYPGGPMLMGMVT